jgi:hypothetical protein
MERPFSLSGKIKKESFDFVKKELLTMRAWSSSILCSECGQHIMLKGVQAMFNLPFVWQNIKATHKTAINFFDKIFEYI